MTRKTYETIKMAEARIAEARAALYGIPVLEDGNSEAAEVARDLLRCEQALVRALGKRAEQWAGDRATTEACLTANHGAIGEAWAASLA